MEEHQEATPQSFSHEVRPGKKLVVLDRSLFRTALLIAAVFLILLTAGALWTFSALQNRQTEVLRKEFAHLGAQIRNPAIGLSLDPESDPRVRIDLLEKELDEAMADLARQEAREREMQEQQAREQERLAQEQQAAAEADTPSVVALSSDVIIEDANLQMDALGIEDYTLPEDPALAASREAGNSALSESQDQTAAPITSGAPETNARIAVLTTPANPAPTAAATPETSVEQSAPSDEPVLPVKKFRVKARIKKNPSSGSGGLFLASPEARNQENLQQETNKYLSKSNNLPLGLPVVGSQIGSRFGGRADPFNRRSAFHSGLDFPAKTGTPVRSTADGMVTYSGFARDYGHHIIISHGRDFETLYAHLSKRLVESGRMVRKGHKIGLIGSTGRSTGPHLHYEIRQHGKVVNPMEYIAGGKIDSSMVKQDSKKSLAKKTSKTKTSKQASKKKSSQKVAKKKSKRS